MATKSGIEWTDATWNPVTGCDKISPGCKHCYAERLAHRLQAMGNKNYENGFAVALQPHMLQHPLLWRKPKRIFVNSMSDLFHERVSLEYIQGVFGVMNQANWHQYQILTKRAERLEQLDTQLMWSPHIWMGVSVESEKYLDRIDHLRSTGAHIKFLSIEPLLEGLGKLNLHGIDWVIVGGESGPGARPMHPEWVADIRNQCCDSGVAFFFKQWGAWAPASQVSADKPLSHAMTHGGIVAEFCRESMIAADKEVTQWEGLRHLGKSMSGRKLDDRTWDEMPKEKGNGGDGTWKQQIDSQTIQTG